MAGRQSRQDKKIRVFVADDHPVVRQGIIQLINREPDMTACGEAETAAETLKNIVRCRPDVAVIDANLKGGSGLDLVKDLKVRMPKTPLLILSMHDETLYAERYLRAGARGYIMKEEAADKVMTAIRRVHAGEIYLSERMADRLLHKLASGQGAAGESPVERLSDREFQIYRLIGEGLATREIADKLHLSIKTIETHRANLKTKLQLTSSGELLRHAIQWVQSRDR